MLSKGLQFISQQSAIAAQLSSHFVSKTDKELLDEHEEEERRKIEEEKEHDPDNYTGYFMHNYMKFSQFSRMIVHKEYEDLFNTVMIFAILMAGVLVGIQMYPSMNNNYYVGICEYLILSFFLLEALLKIAAQGIRPHRYFVGPDGSWNTFDFFVIILCLPFMESLFAGKSQIIRMITRLSRLVRASKIVRQIPALHVIIMGLVGGLKSIMYIAVLLMLVYYFYAVIGVLFFRENDPFNFRTIPIAILTLFKCCTLDGWGDIFKTNAYGCNYYDSGLYVSEADVDSSFWETVPSYYRCTQPAAQPIISSLFFISFIVISALVMLALFIGCITMSMQESLNVMKKEVEEANRKHRLLRQKQEIDALLNKSNAINIAKKFAFQMAQAHDIKETFLGVDVSCLVACGLKVKNSIIGLFVKDTNIDISIKEAKRLKELEEMRTLLLQAWGKTSKASKAIYKDDLEKSNNKVHQTALMAHSVLESQVWNNFMTITVIFTALLIGIETDNLNASKQTLVIYNGLEWLIFGIFLTDLILHFAAEEFRPSEYFKQTWNCIDFAIVVSSILPGGGSIVNIVRLMRLLRVLKLVKAFPELTVIVNALIMGIQSIAYIGCIVSLTYYLFAILGMILFQKNDPLRFGSLHLAVFTLFDVATLDNWSDVLYTQFYGCKHYPPPMSRSPLEEANCTNHDPQGMLAIAFFVIFVVVGALVMLTLFVGVVTTSMEEATENQNVEKMLEDKMKEAANASEISSDQLDIYRRVFALLDLDGGGSVDKEELRTGLTSIGMKPTDEELNQWVFDVDQNADGVVDLIEFCVFMQKMSKIVAEKTGQEVETMRKLNVEKRAAQILIKFRKKVAAKLQARRRKGISLNADAIESLHANLTVVADTSKKEVIPSIPSSSFLKNNKVAIGCDSDPDPIVGSDTNTTGDSTSNTAGGKNQNRMMMKTINLPPLVKSKISSEDNDIRSSENNNNIYNNSNSKDNHHGDDIIERAIFDKKTSPVDPAGMKEIQSLLAHPSVNSLDRSVRRRKKYLIQDGTGTEKDESAEDMPMEDPSSMDPSTIESQQTLGSDFSIINSNSSTININNNKIINNNNNINSNRNNNNSFSQTTGGGSSSWEEAKYIDANHRASGSGIIAETITTHAASGNDASGAVLSGPPAFLSGQRQIMMGTGARLGGVGLVGGYEDRDLNHDNAKTLDSVGASPAKGNQPSDRSLFKR